MDTDHDVFVFEKNFPLFRALCLESGTNGDDLTLFEQTYRSIAAIAGQFDYQDVKYNGYRMALRAVHKYMVRCTSQRPQGAPSMFLLLNFFLKYTKIIYDKSNNNLEPCDPTITFKALNEFQEIKSHLVDIIAPYMGTLHSPQSGHYYSFLPALVSLMTAKSPIDLVKRLVSKAYRNWTVVDLCFTMSTSDITAIFSIPETKFLLYLHGWYFDLMYRDVCRKTVMLNLESKFVFKVVQLPRVDVLVEKGSGSVSKVRCRLYSNKNFGSSRTKLIFHVHGGGYMGGSPESHEIYLVEYARQLPEAAILSVDYQLAPSSKFPSYLQEVFDAYQWVTSGTADVHEKLGYLPLDIIMTGDSCGMDTLMAMVCAINDIRKQWPNSEAVPPLPSAMCSAYATFVLSQGPYPSMMVAVFDCLLTPRTMTVAHNEFNPLGIETNGKHLDHNDIPDAVLAKQSELLVHPYWSPLFYKHFEDLKDIKLILLVTTVDHFGDTSVLMARQWRGPCELVVIEGEPHGFLHLNGISKSATVATNVMIDKLKTCLN